MADHHGLIWCGTDKGVFTFDGITFDKAYSPDSGEAIVNALYEDRNNTIWAGLDNGRIITIEGRKVVPYRPQEGIPKVGITAFAEDDEGKIFFSTKGEGVYCIDRNKLYNINHEDALSDDYGYDLVMIPGKNICVGTDAGLNFISFMNGKKTVEVMGTSDGLPDDIVRTLALDKNKTLWMGFQEKGIASIDFSTGKLSLPALMQPWKFGQVNCLLPLNDQLWVGTEEYGLLSIHENGSIRFVRNEEKSIKCNDMLQDINNNVWLAESIHLYRTSGNKISFYKEFDGKKLQFIHCIIADSSGNIWFTPDQQLTKAWQDDAGKFHYREFKVVEKKIDIVTLYFDPYGFLWIGTLGDGVIRFNPLTGKTRRITGTSDAATGSILSINGEGNHVYVAGFNSVERYRIESAGNTDDALIVKDKTFDNEPLQGDYIYSVFNDSRGMIWFGTDASGVFSYDGKKFTNYPVPENAVYSFTEDLEGRIWFSTANAGIECIDRDFTRKKIQTKQGLSDPSPTSILCTKTGSIVVMNENGFDVLNPKTGNIIYHSSEENLADINCDLNSITTTGDGKIWMGTERGIICYDPWVDMQFEQPNVFLQSVSTLEEGIYFHDKNEFGYDENTISFNYLGLWYSDPLRVTYQYMLDGHSSAWETTKDHTVNFPKLPPGNYKFKVKASLNSIFTNSNEAVYSFNILPPIWQRWWFRLVAAGVIALIIYIIVRRREERLRKFDRLQKEKIEFQFETLKSQVNPHFLFNSFNTLIAVIEDTPKQAVEYVERLSEFFRNLVNYRDRNLISLEEELSLLDNYIFIQKKRYGDNLILKIMLDKEIRQNRFIPPLTLQLLAENGLKHNAVSRETPLTIIISTEGERLLVLNNINKKRTTEASAGFGLENIRNMYALLTKEKIEITHTSEKFIVSIPLLTPRNEYSDRRR